MIKNILIDCDGVLTDGKKYVDSEGHRQMIAFHSRDNEAIKCLIREGYRVMIATASNFTGIWHYWTRQGAQVYAGLKSKKDLDVIGGFDWSETLGVGDDVMDMEYLEKCAIAYVPADAHPILKKKFNPLVMKGGAGIMPEIVHRLENIHSLNGTTTIA